MFTRELSKSKLKRLGLSYRKAAPLLNVTYQHLCLVLNGHRDSARILRAIERLSASEVEADLQQHGVSK